MTYAKKSCKYICCLSGRQYHKSFNLERKTMKKPRVVLILLLIILINSVLGKQFQGHCKYIDEECTNDEECCGLVCRRSFSLFKKYCKESFSLSRSLKNYIFPKESEKEICKRGNKSFDDSYKKQRSKLYARHARFPIDSKLEVTHQDKKINIPIIDRPENESEEVLVLSEEAAKALGISEEEIAFCGFKIIKGTNNPISVIYFVPIFFISLFLGIYLKFFYNAG